MTTYLVRNIRLRLEQEPEAIKKAAAKKMGLREQDFSMQLYRESIDARKEPLTRQYQVLADTGERPRPDRRDRSDVVEWSAPILQPVPGAQPLSERPVVVGTGPCGLFAAYLLASHGYHPIVLERGRRVADRVRDVDAFWATGQLRPDSNVQFGEGGAGTFSDGKLTSRSKDPRVHLVLSTFHQFGAPEEILWQQYPHVGTDLLRGVVQSMRQAIIALGGEFRFETALLGLRCAPQAGSSRAKIEELLTTSGALPASPVILAIGHSARDTFRALHRDGVPMENKPFAMGFRIEHAQSLIERVQYGRYAGDSRLPRASYRLSAAQSLPAGFGDRGVYTFCMCPGGVVVNASSEPQRLCVNGMSYHARDGRNANSAVLATIGTNDLGSALFSGVTWQEEVERRAFQLGGQDYTAPVQSAADFLRGTPTSQIGSIEPTIRPAYRPADLSSLFPPSITHALRKALEQWDQRIPGFADENAVLTGVEARSSSPVRILRDTDFQSTGVEGLYPAGEGAGYAGGIVSSAIDGIKAACALIETYAQPS
ncbi:MAG: NAD(P)-binding protein [Ndongobacter sp.]|nr:NAD(P)-binding protein [Ndongobacter sp.]